MADNVTTPIADGTAMATKDLGGVHIPKNAIVDQAGADAVGLVTTTPAANTILGRLKAIYDAIAGTLTVSAESLPLPTGAATEAKQDAIVSAIESAEYYPTTQPVSAASLPLPSGAATAAKQDEIKASIDATALVLPPFPITPHATDPLPRQITAIALQEAGDVTFRAPGAGSDETVSLPAGMFPFPATHIRVSGTTATGLTGF